MFLDSKTYDYIVEKIIEMLKECNIREYPIDAKQIAQKLGIELIPYNPFENEELMSVSSDGFAVQIGTKEQIYYNEFVMEERRNWTILHEIAHFVLEHNINCLKENQDSEYAEKAESEANYFAKYAVAPPPIVDCIKPTCAQDIADAFRISITAANYSYSYYLKWLNRHNRVGEYFDYEQDLLGQVRWVA